MKYTRPAIKCKIPKHQLTTYTGDMPWDNAFDTSCYRRSGMRKIIKRYRALPITCPKCGELIY